MLRCMTPILRNKPPIPALVAALLVAAAPATLEAQDTDTDPATIPAPPVRGPVALSMEGAAARAQSALVVIRCQGDPTGVGFAMNDPRMVVTDTRNVRCRRALTVSNLRGETVDARVVRGKRRSDISLVALDGSLGLEPLEARRSALNVGEVVHAVALPRTPPAPNQPLTPVVTQGRVSYSDSVQVVSNTPRMQGSNGGPLLDARGQVIGVQHGRARGGLTRSLAIGPIYDLAVNTSVDNPDVRPVLYPAVGGSISFLWDSGDRLFGGGLSLGMDIFDQAMLWAEIGVYGGEQEQFTETTQRLLTILDFGVGYRARIHFGRHSLSITPTLGMSFTHERQETTQQLVMLEDPNCDMAFSFCALDSTEVEVRHSDWRYRPSASLRFDLAKFQVGYHLYLDVEDARDSGHRMLVGFRF